MEEIKLKGPICCPKWNNEIKRANAARNGGIKTANAVRNGGIKIKKGQCCQKWKN